MSLWRHIRQGLWVAGIACVLLLATVECLYRATLTRLPLLPGDERGGAAAVLEHTPLAAAEGSALLQVRALMPWTLLKVITAVLRARKRDTSSLERFALANHAARRWLHLLDPQAPRRNPGFELLLSGREALRA
jgi:hypothetical protein